MKLQRRSYSYANAIPVSSRRASSARASSAKERRRYAPRLPPEQRREQLIDAALSVIVEEGYEGISIEAIARAAGVTRPVVYDHFPNLAALLQTLIAREEERSLGQLAAVVPKQAYPEDPAEALLGGVRRFLDAVGERPTTWRLILLPLEGTPSIVREHVENNRARILERIEHFVRASVESGHLPAGLDVELAARTLRDLAEDAGRMVLTDPERFSPERYASFVRSIVTLRGAPPGTNPNGAHL
jgi:AcrR family transcriptional regulator